jgi:hypothetical protein
MKLRYFAEVQNAEVQNAEVQNAEWQNAKWQNVEIQVTNILKLTRPNLTYLSKSKMPNDKM